MFSYGDRMLLFMAHTQAIVTLTVPFRYRGWRPLLYFTGNVSVTSRHRKSPCRLHRLSGHLHLTVGISEGILLGSLSTSLVNVHDDLSPMNWDCGWA
uniref:Uncharacterized protein n=1 Tax=Ixodes ricinus TaxID=34613 RepID=A0A6B0U4K8_IXORI